MMIIRKSPNMMSTIGRMPVMAAPTPMPVKPASEIGVSMIPSLPNSSTRPTSTLNVVPASATSSPMSTTVGSRRISSAIASLIASPKDSSRTAVASSGIDVLVHLAGIGIWRVDGKLHRSIHLRNQLFLDRIQLRPISDAVVHHPLTVQRDRIALGHPLLLFRLRTIVGASDVAHVMTVIAIGLELEERRTITFTRALDELGCNRVHVTDVLAINGLGRHPEGLRPGDHIAGGRFRKMGVLVVAVVLTREDHRQLPELCEIELFVEEALPQRAFAEEADRDAILLEILRRKRCTSRDAGAAADDGVRPEVAGCRVGDVHRAALALAVAGFLAEQFSEHQIRRRAFGQAVPVTPVGAGDVVVSPQRLAHADGNRFLTDVQVREARHQGSRVKIVNASLEQGVSHHN